MDFLDQIGAEAYLSVNVGSGTPQEASEWLEYLTTAQPTTLAKERVANGHPAPYKVAFLGIGNESWDCGGNMTPDYYLSQLKIYSRFVRNFNPAQQDKQQMLKIAVGPGGGESRWTEWTEAVMKAYQSHTWSWDMNGLSMHSYTVVKWPPSYASVGFGETEYAQILKSTLEMNDLVEKHSAIMDKYDPEKKVALVVDEWGGWYAPLPGSTPGFLVQQNSLRDAVLAALNLNIFARHADRVRMANIAQMINVLQAMILTDKEKMVLTPTYYVYKMYVPFQDATFVPVSFDAGTYTHGDITLPRVDAIAAKDKAGKLWLAITNVDPNQSGWYAPLPGSNPGFLAQQNSLRDAVIAALNLNIFARHADRVRMANIAQMINVLQAMIMTDKEKMVLTPTYYVYKMYVPFQDATFVPATFDAGTFTRDGITLPRIDAIAAKDKAGKLWLSITNVDPNQSAEIEITLAGINAKSAAGETLSASKVDSVNTLDTPNTVVPKPISAKAQDGKLTVKLEPKSVTVVAVEQ